MAEHSRAPADADDFAGRPAARVAMPLLPQTAGTGNTIGGGFAFNRELRCAGSDKHSVRVVVRIGDWTCNRADNSDLAVAEDLDDIRFTSGLGVTLEREVQLRSLAKVAGLAAALIDPIGDPDRHDGHRPSVVAS